MNIAANKQEQFEALVMLLGRSELARDPRFADREDRKQHRTELKAELEISLAARPAGKWAEVFNARGIPAGEVLSVPQILEHTQVVSRGLIKTFEDVPGVDAPVRVVRSGFRLASGDPAPASPPPSLGEHTSAILAEIGYSPEEIVGLRQERVL